MGAWDTWNVEINILVYEDEMFSLPAEFHFNNDVKFNFQGLSSSFFFLIEILQI